MFLKLCKHENMSEGIVKNVFLFTEIHAEMAEKSLVKYCSFVYLCIFDSLFMPSYLFVQNGG